MSILDLNTYLFFHLVKKNIQLMFYVREQAPVCLHLGNSNLCERRISLPEKEVNSHDCDYW